MSGPINTIIPVTVTGSPFIYTNNEDMPYFLIISGVGIQEIAWRRPNDPAFYDAGFQAGIVSLMPHDSLRVTYVGWGTTMFRTSGQWT